MPYDTRSKLGVGRLKICIDKVLSDEDLTETYKLPAGLVFADDGTADSDHAPWWNLAIVATQSVTFKKGVRCMVAAAQVVINRSPGLVVRDYPPVHAFKKSDNRQLIPLDRILGPPWDYVRSDSAPFPNDLPDLDAYPDTDFQ